MEEQNAAASGFGLAGFLIQVNTLGALVRAGILQMSTAADILTRARSATERLGLPGDAMVQKYAHLALEQAEQVLRAAAAEKPQTGPH